MVFRQSNYIIYYDFGQKKIINLFYLDSKAMNLDFCPENGYAAYTVGNNLFINNKGDDDEIIILYQLTIVLTNRELFMDSGSP